MMAKFRLSAFGDEISPDLSVQISVLQKNGIEGLEFRSMKEKGIIFYPPDEIKEAEKMLSDAGIRVSAVGSPIGKIPVTDPFPPHLELFKKTVETAHLLKTPNIRMFSFYTPKGEDPEKYRGEVMDRWAQFVRATEGSGLTLLHENEKEIYGDTADRCLDLMKTMDSPLVRNIIDPANYVQVGEEVYPRAWELLSDYTVYMHIKDARYADKSVVPAGEGDGKIGELLRALVERGYDGWLSIEPHLAPGGQPGGGEALFKKAADALKSLLDTVGARVG